MDKELFKKKAKETIDDLFNKIDELEQKRDKASEVVRASISEKLSELKRQKRELGEKYDELESATSDSWIEVKNAFSKSAEIFKNTIANISRNFK